VLTQAQIDLLNADLPADAVKTRKAPGGADKPLSYVDGFYVIDRMNKVFQPGGWGPVDVEIVKITETVETTEKGERHRVAYVVKAHLRAEGIPTAIVDVGFGSAIDKDLGSAHEKASKEAVTDAVKRCCRYLGRSMGLALYDKEQKHVESKAASFVALYEACTTPKHLEDANGVVKPLWASLELEDQVTIKQARLAAEERVKKA
jgi:recombination DNA repair RAD52 pathway protein